MLELDFDVENVQTTEFGVGKNGDGSRIFENVPVDRKIKDELFKYARTTLNIMQNQDETPQEYDPSDETASTKYVYLPLSNDMAGVFRELQNAENLRKIFNLSDTPDIFCYFARFTDSNNRRLTAVRKTFQFRSLGKGFSVWIDGTLKLMSNPIFKLDTVFDLFIDSKLVHILHPKSFESVGELKKFVLNSVEKNTEIIQNYLPFVDLEPVKDYAAEHIRTARYLASIRARSWAKNIDKDELKSACVSNNVKISESEGMLDVSEDISGFLEILDRRRYSIGLVANMPEQFRAASRHKINP
ncbi:MAG: DUF4868 domain-containing protein [Thaumarchaeota archaeon]|nr:DUF4868 domain-containing protein [Nitrososphaerota archaeon]